MPRSQEKEGRGRRWRNDEFLVRVWAASGVIPRPLLSIIPDGDDVTLAAAWKELATENAAVEDAKGA